MEPVKEGLLFEDRQPAASPSRSSRCYASRYVSRWRIMVFPPFSVDFLLSLILSFMKRFGKDNFQESMKISNRVKQAQIDWQKFRYMVFDVPNHTGTYEERYNLLGNYFTCTPNAIELTTIISKYILNTTL